MELDWGILYWIQENLRCTVLDAVMPFISSLSNVGMIWIVAMLVMLVTKKYRKYGLILAAMLLFFLLFGQFLLKELVARPRPCWEDPSVALLIPVPHDYSFPSGHSFASTIGAIALTAANRKFGFVAIPLAALTAFSRLYLFVHFPSDVLYGVLMGLITGLLILYFSKKLPWEKILGSIDRTLARRRRVPRK